MTRILQKGDYGKNYTNQNDACSIIQLKKTQKVGESGLKKMAQLSRYCIII